ncbi:outer membrane beta-barrel protein [Halomonas sp. EGI 63088]|uniref:Outer membrane beta-barrel protein n=1 Tax=Halomonas flagellata TaxID=2920385 RepID=A0ABS9RVK6_9GAMM|nr:outer membrane beta-barrel protein [Halomonas flagellata]MCH4563886.1 outer membrane beta-barrel protein [Halomonas flagellata]
MKRLIATAALATLVASPAFAQSPFYNPDAGPYLGAGIGHAKLDNDTLDLLDDIGASTDDTDVSFKLFAGYQFNPYFAVEASYVDFGDFTASGSEGGDSASLKLGFDGFTAALVGKLPIQSGFSLFGKLGMIAWDADLDFNATIQGQSFQGSGGEDGTDLFYGIGTEYVINQIIMRAEFERYDISESGEDFEIDMFSGSIGYRF